MDDANKEAEKYKNEVANLLKKAIYEIYREGREVLEANANKASEIIDNQRLVEEDVFLLLIMNLSKR
ncbi:hypothetical protein ABW636_06285 [Aquimarina sp. 2201CG1-2-11]|uniref:hypothetical protein n=1 Tax=Aquimarina discodermiae TaxID=3231043 RepID=UPI003462C66C